MLDDPCKEVTKYLKGEGETLVHLICQKATGTQRPIPEYLIESCPIIVQKEMYNIPQLDSILSSHLTQVR